MTKIKGVCKLVEKSDANFTKDLVVGKVYDFEKEYLEAFKEFGYYIILSPTETKKMKESTFKLHFKEKPADAAPKETAKETVKEENKQEPVAEEKSKLNSPKKDIIKEDGAIRSSPSQDVLMGWMRYEHIINSITLKPFDGKSGMVTVIVNIKPDIDLTMTGPASNVFNGILQSLEKLTTLEGKISDLEKIIDERIKLETKKKADAEKKVEKPADKVADKPAEKVADKTKGKTTEKKPVETKPEVAQTSLDMGAGQPEPNKEDWGDDEKNEETTDNGDGEGGDNASDIDNW